MPTTNSPAQIIALWFTGVIALIGMATFAWCAIFKTYIDVPMLLVLQAVTVGGVSSFTTLLTGRTLAQLNQPGTETTMTQTTQTVTKPKPPDDVPLVITKQPEVAIAGEKTDT